MAYVAPTVRSVGDAVTAADYNIMANNAISFRNKSGIVPPACKVYKTGGASITDNTVITWDLERFDTDTMHSTVTNTGRITINTAGIYLVSFVYLVNFSGTITKEQPQIRKNGGSNAYNIKYGSGVTNTAHSMHTILNLAATDYVEALITFTGGSSFVIDGNEETSFFSAVMLGATS